MPSRTGAMCTACVSVPSTAHVREGIDDSYDEQGTYSKAFMLKAV